MNKMIRESNGESRQHQKWNEGHQRTRQWSVCQKGQARCNLKQIHQTTGVRVTGVLCSPVHGENELQDRGDTVN